MPHFSSSLHRTRVSSASAAAAAAADDIAGSAAEDTHHAQKYSLFTSLLYIVTLEVPNIHHVFASLNENNNNVTFLSFHRLF